MDKKIEEIISRAWEGKAPTYEEVVEMLECDEASPEATAIRSAADGIQREKTGNAATIWGQIGIEVYPCEADCQFCSFGKSHTCFTDHVVMPVDEVVRRAVEFAKGGDLYGLYLMTMNTFDEDHYLECVKAVRAAIPTDVRLISNIGDTTEKFFRKLKDAGVSAVYHVKRLGEGCLTKITPERREQTIHAAHAAGLKVEECCEPVGAETPVEDIATRLMEIRQRDEDFGGLDTTGVMKRTSVPGTRYEGLENEITNLRMAQMNAIETLLMCDRPHAIHMGHHEANLISLVSGSNCVTAETGFNPRDTAEDTSAARGLDVPAVRELYYQAGFRRLMKGDGSYVDLTPEYMEAKLSE